MEHILTIPKLIRIFFHTFDISQLQLPINKTQEKILMFILHHDNLPMNEIGKFAGLEKGSFTSATDHLVEIGYIRRDRVAKDRRVVNLSLTEKGMEVTEKIKKEFEKQIQSKLNLLNMEELEEFLYSLEVTAKYSAILEERIGRL
jgi:DNA-binding MarR family transcriptional regulator